VSDPPSDERGFRVAVVPDALANPQDGCVDALGVLARAGWGTILLPPAWYPPDARAPLLEQAAEHIEEFTRHGYRVVCVGDCSELTAPLAALGATVPPAVPAGSEAALQRALPA
jgi:hypothetical protein